MTACVTNPEIFFNYVDSFINYRQTVYEVSEQCSTSLNSNCDKNKVNDKE
jgi:hypothetical protein